MEEAKIAVRYYSKSGNTKKLADAIAGATGCTAASIPEPIDGEVDVLFLGASVYWGGISSVVKDYIQSLDKTKVGKVVVFSTSALAERAFPQLQKKLEAKGIQVANKNFYCRGEFAAFHKGRPNQSDLKNAKKFALEMVKKS